MSYPVYYPEEGDVLPIFFDSFDGGTGASITLTGLAVTDIEIYKDGGVTQRASDAGYTLLDTDGIDFDGITGIHGFSIDLSDNTDAGFFTVGPWYHVVVSAVTIDGQTVNFIAAAFRIASAVRGLAGTALPNAAADAAGGLPISDAGGLDMDAQLVTKINDILTDTGTTLQAEVDGIQADTEDIQSRLPAALTAGGNMKADSLAFSGSTTAANNAEIVFDTDFATNYNATDKAWAVDLWFIEGDPVGTSPAGDPAIIATGTIGSTGNDTTHLHLTGLTFADDGLNELLIRFLDVSTGLYHSRWISDWVNATALATIDPALPATPENAVDTYTVLAVRKDVTSGSGLDAAGVRAAIGMASANLDTQLADIPTVAEFEARTLVAANYFDPATDAVATVTNLTNAPTNGDLTATMKTSVQTAATASLNAYDPPTNAEMVARTLAAADYFDPAADTVANVTTVGSVTTKTGYSLASTGLDLVLVAGVSVPEALRRIGTITSGEVSGAGTGTETFEDWAASAATIVITVDGSGNRTAITYN